MEVGKKFEFTITGVNTTQRKAESCERPQKYGDGRKNKEKKTLNTTQLSSNL